MLFAISLSALIALSDDLPVHNSPERSQVVRSAVLIIQIVGMLPDVESQQWFQTLLNRIGSIRLLRNHKFPILISR